eukprot:2378872-Prymnesium_polylepis.1
MGLRDLEIARDGDLWQLVRLQVDARRVEDTLVELRERRAAEWHRADGAPHDVPADDRHDERHAETD